MSVHKVIFVSDPLCSWCWGMARDIESVRRAFVGRLSFDVLMGGINVTAETPLPTNALARFSPLWAHVIQITGQQFAMRLPEDGPFVYNSLPACRGVVAARIVGGEPPFAFLHALQAAFFIEARNTTRLDVLLDIAAQVGMDAKRFAVVCAAAETSEALQAELASARGYGTNALPAVLVETARGRSLLAGGYVNAEMLTQTLEQWLQRDPVVLN